MLTVITPPTSSALAAVTDYTSLPGAIASLSSSQIMALIAAKSEQIASYCGHGFGRRVVQQTERPPYVAYSTYDPLWPGIAYREPYPIALQDAAPLVSMNQIVLQDGTILTQNVDYEIDGMRIFRLFNDRRVVWAYPKIVLTYMTGYWLPNDTIPPGDTSPVLPADVKQACLDLVHWAAYVAKRDPTATFEEAFGVARQRFSELGGKNSIAARGGMPDPIAQLLAPYVHHAVA